MAKIVLITGGTRSGKSSFALDLAEQYGCKRLFLATSPRLDSEMTDRIHRHQAERAGRGWETVEEQVDLKGVLSHRTSGHDVVLLDCVTLWVNNVLHEKGESQLTDAIIYDLCLQWLQAVDHWEGTLVCVTSEVGLGVVPENRLARKYRDLVGTCNQLIGKLSGKAVLVSCGIPVVLKS